MKYQYHELYIIILTVNIASKHTEIQNTLNSLLKKKKKQIEIFNDAFPRDDKFKWYLNLIIHVIE